MSRSTLVAVLALATPLAAYADSWKNAPILNTNCVEKMKANPDKHTRKCALECSKGNGFGILVDGAYLKFDEAGNKLALDGLKKTTKKDHLRVDVTGAKEGDSIKVQSVKFD